MAKPQPLEVVVTLPLTGERTAPGWPRESYWFARHEAVYDWLAQRCAPSTSTVIDVGCGEGYGCHMLAAGGARVVGIELDTHTCIHAAHTYPATAFVRGNVVALPIRSSVADLVVSLQVMEHIWDVSTYLAELRRVAKGQVVISTPNRPIFSPGLGRGERPANPFHVEEFDASQLRELLTAAGFTKIRLYGLHHADRLAAWEADHGSIVSALTAAAVSGTWSPALDTFLQTVNIQDFMICDELANAHDLIVIGS